MITLRFLIKSLSLFLIIAALASCSLNQENATKDLNQKGSSTRTIDIQLDGTTPFGSIRGKIIVQKDIWGEGTQLTVFTSNFYKGSSDQEGFFLYDSGTSKQVQLEKDGSFELSQIEQGDYVLLIGPTPEYARALTMETGETMVIHVEVSQVTDIGTIQISD
jgi:hypothetical protein